MDGIKLLVKSQVKCNGVFYRVGETMVLSPLYIELAMSLIEKEVVELIPDKETEDE